MFQCLRYDGLILFNVDRAGGVAYALHLARKKEVGGRKTANHVGGQREGILRMP